MKSRTRKVTYSAVAASLALVIMLLSQLTTLRLSLLACSLCYYVALQKSGLVFGIISAISSILLIIFMGFLEVGLLTAIVFAPFALIAFLLKGLTYKAPLHIALRAIVMTVFANIVLMVCYLLSELLLPQLDIQRILSLLGGYPVLAVIISAVAVATDYVFGHLCQMLIKAIK